MSGSQSSGQERLLRPTSDVSGREGALLHREPPPGLKVQAVEALTAKSMSKQREKHLKAGSQSQQKDSQPVRNLPQVQVGPGGKLPRCAACPRKPSLPLCHQGQPSPALWGSQGKPAAKGGAALILAVGALFTLQSS